MSRSVYFELLYSELKVLFQDELTPAQTRQTLERVRQRVTRSPSFSRVLNFPLMQKVLSSSSVKQAVKPNNILFDEAISCLESPQNHLSNPLDFVATNKAKIVGLKIQQINGFDVEITDENNYNQDTYKLLKAYNVLYTLSNIMKEACPKLDELTEAFESAVTGFSDAVAECEKIYAQVDGLTDAVNLRKQVRELRERLSAKKNSYRKEWQTIATDAYVTVNNVIEPLVSEAFWSSDFKSNYKQKKDELYKDYYAEASDQNLQALEKLAETINRLDDKVIRASDEFEKTYKAKLAEKAEHLERDLRAKVCKHSAASLLYKYEDYDRVCFQLFAELRDELQAIEEVEQLAQYELPAVDALFAKVMQHEDIQFARKHAHVRQRFTKLLVKVSEELEFADFIEGKISELLQDQNKLDSYASASDAYLEAIMSEWHMLEFMPAQKNHPGFSSSDRFMTYDDERQMSCDDEVEDSLIEKLPTDSFNDMAARWVSQQSGAKVYSYQVSLSRESSASKNLDAEDDWVKVELPVHTLLPKCENAAAMANFNIGLNQEPKVKKGPWHYIKMFFKRIAGLLSSMIGKGGKRRVEELAAIDSPRVQGGSASTIMGGLDKAGNPNTRKSSASVAKSPAVPAKATKHSLRNIISRLFFRQSKSRDTEVGAGSAARLTVVR